MSKATNAKAKKELMGKVRRNLEPAEILQLTKMVELANARKFEADQIKVNTALVPRGQEVANEVEAVARLLENVKNQYVGQLLVACGYDAGQNCNINLSTGEIIVNKDEPKNG